MLVGSTPEGSVQADFQVFFVSRRVVSGHWLDANGLLRMPYLESGMSVFNLLQILNENCPFIV
jgi:hypothetical protein